MSVNALGVQPQVGYEKPKKNNSVVAGTIICGGAGAIGGYSVGEYLTGDLLDEARLNCKSVIIKTKLRKNLPKNVSDDVFETFWKSNKDKLVKDAKASYQETLKITQKAKTKFAIIGGLICAGIGYIGNKLFGKKEK